MPEFKVSVITPVYNAGPYLRHAVEAALAQPETGEVILVEDGSPDNSLDVCRTLAREFAKVRLVRHPDGQNHGAGATRNLGLQNASCDYVAFADADNFYLPGRFARDGEILSGDPTLDGVYNAQGVHYYSDAARESFFEAGLGGAEFLSISRPVPPEEFWKVMLGQHADSVVVGGLGIDAITLKRACLEKIGPFEPALKLQQDVHFYIRMAASCRMAAGVLDRPVAMRGVHSQMRSTDPVTMARYRRDCWMNLKTWFENNVTDEKLRFGFDQAFFRRRQAWTTKSGMRLAFARFVAGHPRTLIESDAFFDVNLLDVFGRTWLTLHALSLKNRVLRMVNPVRSSPI